MAAPALQQSERLVVLDVLRGIALLGMFFVHFNGNAIEPDAGFGLAYRRFVELFFQTQFWAMFAILFGAGFAVQLRRAGTTAGAFVLRYGRRLLALAAFGLIAEIGFGYSVLVGYAIWGVPLLLVRRWSNKALLILLVLCAASQPIRSVGRAVYWTPERWAAGQRTATEQDAAVRKQYQASQRAPDYGTVVSGRLRRMPHAYSTAPNILPRNDFTLFLIGLLALRLGLFDQPQRHRRLIAAVIIFGVLSWAVSRWLFPLPITPAGPFPLRVATQGAIRGFGLVRDHWLALTYIGGVLLLVARNPAWLERLSFFAITGRMALTNYMLQVIVLDLTFSNYALGLQVSALVAPLAALALFGVQVVFCRWWLSRFSYGPLEWLWRSATYARWQPFRCVPVSKFAVVEAGL